MAKLSLARVNFTAASYDLSRVADQQVTRLKGKPEFKMVIFDKMVKAIFELALRFDAAEGDETYGHAAITVEAIYSTSLDMNDPEVDELASDIGSDAIKRLVPTAVSELNRIVKAAGIESPLTLPMDAFIDDFVFTRRKTENSDSE